MPRLVAETNLSTRAARARLQPRPKPYWHTVSIGQHIGYRKSATAGGAWIARRSLGGTRYEEHRLGAADDARDADAVEVLTYAQAQAVAVAWLNGRTLETGGIPADAAPSTVSEALDVYRTDLIARGGDPSSVSRCRLHMPAGLLSTRVDKLTPRTLAAWRDGLLAPHQVITTRGKRPAREVTSPALSPASVNRTMTTLKAALNITANRDPARIGTRSAWEIGLAGLPNAERHRNVILPDELVRRIVAGAYALDPAFGLLVEVAASTGSRYSQLARLEVQDLQAGQDTPRLMMPTSMKGRGQKQFTRRPVPITLGLAAKLHQAGQGRPPRSHLLLTGAGRLWTKSMHFRPFAAAVARAELTEAELTLLGLTAEDVTMYALRHSSIVRQLLANVPIRVVAVTHDTSTVMIERNYSAHIADHSDGLARRALVELG